jgi:photosystem II stability/assembly factor-like uncharacterized protein
VAGWNGWASLGGQLASGSVSAVRNGDGRLELFGQSGGASGPEIAHAWQTSPNNGWSSWSSLGSPPAEFLGAMAAAVNANGRLEVFGRVGLMSTGGLYHLWQTAPGNGWSTWDNLGGGIGPQFLLVGTNADGRLEVFAVSTGPGELEHIWQNTPGGGWSSWSSLGTLPGGFPVQLTIGRNADGRLELFNVGGGGLWHNWQTTPGAGWAGWSSLGQPSGVNLTRVAVASNADGRLEVFATGDNALWHIWQTAPNDDWSDWDNLGNPGVSSLDAPSVAVNADGRLEVFVASVGDALFHLYQVSTGGGWSEWDSLGGEPSGPVAVGVNADGRLEVFSSGRDVTGQVWHRWQTTPGGGWSDVPQDWQQLDLAGPARKLYVTTNNALLVRTAAGLFRSQDGGSTWTQLNLPASSGVVEVDPTAGGQILFAAAPGGLQRSTTGGAGWSLVLPATSTVIGVAVSPANSSVVYAAIGQGSGPFSLQRSTDGGTTWTVLENVPHGDLCTWSCFILEAHRLNAQRAFRNINCVAGRNVPGGLAVQQTLDEGVSWTDLFHPVGLYPSRLVGGLGTNTQRWYLGAYLSASPGGGTYYRSNDDGASWSAVLTLAAGQSVGGLTYHPSAPDHVYAGVTTASVVASSDAGASWSPLGSAAIGSVADLALSHDEGTLFAATSSGVWRLFV